MRGINSGLQNAAPRDASCDDYATDTASAEHIVEAGVMERARPAFREHIVPCLRCQVVDGFGFPTALNDVGRVLFIAMTE